MWFYIDCLKTNCTLKIEKKIRCIPQFTPVWMWGQPQASSVSSLIQTSVFKRATCGEHFRCWFGAELTTVNNAGVERSWGGSLFTLNRQIRLFSVRISNISKYFMLSLIFEKQLFDFDFLIHWKPINATCRVFKMPQWSNKCSFHLESF